MPRWIARGVLGLLAVALLVLLISGWLAVSETGLRLAASRASSWSDGKLLLEGVQGSLVGPLQVERLSLTTDEKQFEIRRARLDWAPRQLLRRHLDISQLALAELRIIERKPSAEPPKRPDSLALPVALSAPDVRVDRLVIKSSTGEQVLTGMRLSLEKPADKYQLTVHTLESPWGKLQGRAELAESAPFALAGEASLTHPSGTARLSASGLLDRIRLQADAAMASGTASAELTVNPFAARPVMQALVKAEHVDPSAWNPDWPGADLGLDANLASEAQDTVGGRLTVTNAMPGAWDQGRLPLKRMSTRVGGDLQGVALTDLRLDLGKAGRFAGEGQADKAGLQLTLQTADFDPNGIHGKARPLRLAGEVSIRADARQQQVLADLAYQRYRLKLDATHRDREIVFNEAQLSSAGGSLSLFGTIGLDAARSFQLAGGLSGFDPAAFGNFPKSRLNASFTTAGKLWPKPQGFMRFAVADSQFRGKPLSGQGGFNLSEQRLWDSDVVLRLAGNRLSVQGSFGAPGDQLDFVLKADQPEIVAVGLTGKIDASGQLFGSLAAPSGKATIQADGLAWRGNFRLAKLRAKGSLDQGLDGPMALDGQLQGLNLPDLELARASIAAHGRRSQHTLSLTANNRMLDLAAELAGSWTERQGTPHWSGQIMALRNAGNYPLLLKAPARLEMEPNQLSLAGAHLDFLGSTVNIREARYEADGLTSAGEFSGLGLGALNRLAAGKIPANGDLSLAGNWALEFRDKANGKLGLWRERGDLVMSDVPATPLGLSRFSLAAELADNRVRASLDAVGEKLGRLDVDGQTLLSRRGKIWGIPGDAPVQGTAELAIESLAWASPLLDKRGNIRLEGSVRGQFKAGGTLASPSLTGTATGEGFRLTIPDQGLDLSNGRFSSALEQDTLRLTSLSLSGGEGKLTGTGYLRFSGAQPELKLDLQADKLRALSRPDRLLILSGNGQVDMLEKRVRLTARLKADRGLIELAAEDTPIVSSDVVVVGRQAQPARQGMPYAIDMDLSLELGDRFYLKGRGLDAQLGGAVRLAGKGSDVPSANGSIRVIRGAYSAYGQRLVIDRGILNFQGPLDNPGLNIVAMRKNQQVEAGVAISGTAQTPRVVLVSNPVVPDSEKLAWLVLGHGLAEAGAQEFDSLQIAAGALLGVGESVTLQQRIAQAAGLEEISFKGAGTLESTVLTLGKRLSSRAYLSYEQGLAGTDALVKIQYTLTKRLSLRAQAGTTPAVDLFYTFSFD